MAVACKTDAGGAAPVSLRLPNGMPHRNSGARPVKHPCFAAPIHPSPKIVLRQRSLGAMLFYLATQVAEAERHPHLDALAKALRSRDREPVAIRARRVADLRPSQVDAWFGPAASPSRASVLRTAGDEWSYGPVADEARSGGLENEASCRKADRPASMADGSARRHVVSRCRLTVSDKVGHRTRRVSMARQGVQSADQKR